MINKDQAPEEVTLNRVDVAGDIKTLAACGDLPDEFQKVADWVAAGEMQELTPAAQRQWVGLTDDEKQELVSDEIGRVRDYEDYADAIETKLKEKNNG
jgi:hypothetical protein